MKTYAFFAFLLILAIPFCGFAQQESFILSGRILDANTRAPISIVSLQNGKTLILANARGEFQLKVKPGDHLVISHTAYKPAVYIVEAGEDSPLEILLEEKVVELSEVEVNAFISEERFKREVLMAVPKYDYEHKVAERNLQMVKQIVPLGYAPEVNPYGLFKDATSVNEVSFFSTNPSMGLLKALKQIGQKRTFTPPPSPVIPSEGHVYEFWVRSRKNRLRDNQD